MNKKVLTILISVLVLVVGGGAAYSFVLKKSPKEQYFLAEYKTVKNGIDLFKERYQDEVKWAEVINEKPTAHTFDLSVDYDSDGYSYEDDMISEIVSGTSASINVALDPSKDIVEAKLSGSIMNIPLDEISGYITSEKIMLNLPFVGGDIQLKDKDFGKFMRTLDESYTGNEELGLADLFENRNLLTEEQQKYLLEAYVMYLYKEIPEEAFVVESDHIEVHGKSLNADRISMKLSTKEIEDLLVKMLEKAKSDKKLQNIIIDFIKKYGGPDADYALEMFEESFKEEINNAIKDLKSNNSDGSLESVIWTVNDGIVKRELTVTEDKEDLLVIEGTQLLDKDQQLFSYKLSDDYSSIYFEGELSWRGGKVSDRISLLDDSDEGLRYVGDETLNKGVRTFDRELIFDDGYSAYSIGWKGTSEYKEDRVIAEHTLGFEIEDFSGELNIAEQGKIIKKINVPNDSEVINLGEMNRNELEQYLYDELAPSMAEWFYQYEDELEDLFY